MAVSERVGDGGPWRELSLGSFLPPHTVDLSNQHAPIQSADGPRKRIDLSDAQLLCVAVALGHPPRAEALSWPNAQALVWLLQLSLFCHSPPFHLTIVYTSSSILSALLLGSRAVEQCNLS